MIGIRNIGTYIPDNRINNFEAGERFSLQEDFIERKVGVHYASRKLHDEDASDLCLGAFDDLFERESGLKKEEIDFLCVCTQNGDYQLPQTSSLVQDKLELSRDCASFDVSLGCSGYVYALTIARSFMEAESLKCGLIFTSDPYSTIIDPNDRDTSLIFGDAAAVTLLTERAVFDIGRGAYFTDGSGGDALIKRQGEYLKMNGRQIFNFVMRYAPPNVKECLRRNDLSLDDIHLFLLHQASRYIIDNLIVRMKLDPVKVPFNIENYGNTVSSTLPILLREYISSNAHRHLLLSGFGVGLSVASVVLKRR